MPATNIIAQSIKKALSFIGAQQGQDGAFTTQSAPLEPASHTKLYSYRAIFTNAHILHSLAKLEHPKAQAIADQIAAFLLAQRSPHWSFNYWDRHAQVENKTMPYPDDLDDTFCSLAGLYQHDSEVLDGQAMADIVNILTHTEVAVGGPYRTWMVAEGAPKVWQDVDLAVNANIAYALHLQDIELPALTHLMDRAIATNTYESPYYPHRIPLLYFISRAYQGNQQAVLISHIHQSLKEAWVISEPLYISLMLTALLTLDDTSTNLHHALAQHLINSQAKDGSWAAASLCIDPSHDGIPYVAQAESLTTSFSLEALAMYNKHYQPKAPVAKHSKQADITNAVARSIQVKFATLPKDAQLLGLHILEETIDQDKDGQIMLMPWFTAISVQRGAAIDSSLIVALGQASTYGWIAYTIYDDVLDGELLDPARISLANICLRELTLLFHQALPGDSKFQSMVASTLDQLDSINAWEVLNTRYSHTDPITYSKLPDYGDYSCLAQRSLGHALGPLAILIASGLPADHPEVIQCYQFFKHAIIARQLNDDAHDWEDDLSQGHMTVVNTLIATHALKSGKSAQFAEYRALTATTLREIFWDEVAPLVCNQIQAHVSSAKQMLEAMTCLSDKRLFEAILTKPEKAAQQAIKEREQTLEFIAAYAN